MIYKGIHELEGRKIDIYQEGDEHPDAWCAYGWFEPVIHYKTLTDYLKDSNKIHKKLESKKAELKSKYSIFRKLSGTDLVLRYIDLDSIEFCIEESLKIEQMACNKDNFVLSYDNTKILTYANIAKIDNESLAHIRFSENSDKVKVRLGLPALSKMPFAYIKDLRNISFETRIVGSEAPKVN